MRSARTIAVVRTRLGRTGITSVVVGALDRVGETDYRITEGANERVQLEAMLASLALGE